MEDAHAKAEKEKIYFDYNESRGGAGCVDSPERLMAGGSGRMKIVACKGKQRYAIPQALSGFTYKANHCHCSPVELLWQGRLFPQVLSFLLIRLVLQNTRLSIIC